MKRYYLMIKEHNDTGLKYLCKTFTDNEAHCYKYKGSGVYWKRHMKVHGRNIKTTIVDSCETIEEFKIIGKYWSDKYNIVESDEWANLIAETGDGGPTMLGRQISPAQKIKQGKAISKAYHDSSDEYKAQRAKSNSKSHEQYKFTTPAGIFTNSFKAAKANECSNVTIFNRCRDNKKPISARCYSRNGWLGKTWEELGWSMTVLNE